MAFWDWLNDNAGAVGVIVSATGVVVATLSRIGALQKISAVLVILAMLAFISAAGVAGFAFAPWEKYGALRIEIDRPPPCMVVSEASETTYAVGGRVAGVVNPRRMKLVLYAHTNQWYVQPLADAPFTDIHVDGAFQSETHGGDRYLVLLVTPDYEPAPTAQALASAGDDVIAAMPVACAP